MTFFQIHFGPVALNPLSADEKVDTGTREWMDRCINERCVQSERR